MTWRRLKRLCTDNGQYGFNVPAGDYVDEVGGLRLIRTSDLAGGQLRPGSDGIFVPKPVPSQFILRPNDILLSRSGTIGRCFLVPEAAAGLTFAGFLVRFRALADQDPRYVAYALQSEHAQAQIQADAIVSTIQNFNAERYANLALWIPQLAEQRRIADFLDDQVALLDRAIELRQQQIELMEERFASLVEEVIWLRFAQRPKGRLGFVVSHVTSGPRGWGEFVGVEGTPFFRSANLRRDSLEPKLEYLLLVEPPPESAAERIRASVAEDDILVGVTGANAGWVCHVRDPALVGAVVSQHVAAIRPDPRRVLGRWLAHSLRSEGCARQLSAMQYGGTKTQLSLPNLRDLTIPIIDLEAQGRIVKALDAETLALEECRVLAARHSALLQDRKGALITAAVTGQFDVTTARSVA